MSPSRTLLSKSIFFLKSWGRVGLKNRSINGWVKHNGGGRSKNGWVVHSKVIFAPQKMLKGYLRYKSITSQNVPFKAHMKNFFIS